MGGFVATEAATTAPARFERLVLVSAAGISSTPGTQSTGAASALAFAWKTLGPFFAGHADEHSSRAPAAARSPSATVVHYPAAPADGAARGSRSSRGLHLPRLRRRAAGDRSITTSATACRRSRLPTLVIWGFDDRIVPGQAALSYHRRIPGSRLEIFERTGHVPQLERPAPLQRAARRLPGQLAVASNNRLVTVAGTARRDEHRRRVLGHHAARGRRAREAGTRRRAWRSPRRRGPRRGGGRRRRR